MPVRAATSVPACLPACLCFALVCTDEVQALKDGNNNCNTLREISAASPQARRWGLSASLYNNAWTDLRIPVAWMTGAANTGLPLCKSVHILQGNSAACLLGIGTMCKTWCTATCPPGADDLSCNAFRLSVAKQGPLVLNGNVLQSWLPVDHH